MAGPRAISTDEAIAELERCTTQLGEVLRTHRSATIGAVANGTLTADAAPLGVETVRSLEALSRHAWRSAAHLVGRG
jgi:phosphate:Na+ symporter